MRFGRVRSALAQDRETGWRFTVVLCGLYLLLLAWMHVHHEMWRDEIHAWTLARLANGFGELVTGDRIYDGHPPLWYWYLYVWTWFIKSAVGIQLATIVAAVAAAVLLVRYAPFPRYLKVLLLCSYYFGYEYTVLSRNYVLGWLGGCAFCALYHPLRTRYRALAVCLALLSLTSIYGLAMSLFFLGFWVTEQVRAGVAPAGVEPRQWSVAAPARFLLAVAVVLVAMVFCVLNIEPPDPNPFSPGFNFAGVTLQKLPDMLYRITAGFLAWRHFSPDEFWLSFYTFWEQGSPWVVYVGAAILVATTAALYPSWRLMLCYLAVTVGCLVFQEARHWGVPRHWGHFFVYFVVACWLLRATFPRRARRLSTALLGAFCLVQLQAFVVATVLDTRYVFSGSRETAAFIERAGLQNLPVVAGPDFASITVAGYLRRPFYAAETPESNETVVFHDRRRNFAPSELMDRAIGVAREQKSPVLLLCNEPLPAPPPGVTRQSLFHSRRGTIADETFTVYRLEAR